MREGWEYKKLVDVCSLMAGGDVPKGNFSKEKTKDYQVPVFSNGTEKDGLYGYTDVPKVSKKSITISGRGTIGFVAKRMEPFYPIIRLIVVTPLDNIDVSYLYYFGVSRHFQGNGVAIPQLTVPMIKNEVIPIPPLPAQSHIVSELDLISSIIKKKKAQLKEYDKLAQSIFYDMFGDPVTNEKGWEVKKLGEVYKLKSGDGLSAKQFVDGQYPVYGGNGISGFHNSFNMDGNYIIIGRVGAYCGNVRNVIGKFWLTDNAFQLIYDIKRQNPIFVKFVLTYLDLHQYANHAAQPVISNISLKEIKVPYPPLPLQQSFAEKIEAIEKQKTLVQQSLVETQTMFDYTMDKYFG